MLFEMLIKLLANFGFQMQACENAEEYFEKVGAFKSFCLISPNEIKWYQPNEQAADYMAAYNQNPFFLATPEKLEGHHEDFEVYRIMMLMTDYEQILHVIYFLQSGLVDSFFIKNTCWFYPSVITSHHSITVKAAQGQPADIEEFLKALAQTPDSALLLNYIGKLYNEKHDIENASRNFVAACDKEPHYAEPYSNMGALMWGQGEKAKAFKLFCEAFLRNPFDATIQDNFLQSGIDLHAADAMNEALNKTQEYYPEYKALLYLKALLLERLGQKEESLKVLEAYLLLRPDDTDAQGFLKELKDK